MALYQDGILISGANKLPQLTMADYEAMPVSQRPTYWERLDADYDDILAEKTDIATVESGTTASRAYSVGELVYVSGTLYRVKTAIASGATFTVGTNIEVKNVSNIVSAIPALSSAITNLQGEISGHITVPSSVSTTKLFCYNVALSVANMPDRTSTIKAVTWQGHNYYCFYGVRNGDYIYGIIHNGSSMYSFAYVRSTGAVNGLQLSGTAF